MADGDLYVPHISLTWGGTFWSTEVWQMGLRLNGGEVTNEGEMDGYCEAHVSELATKVKDWFGHNNSGSSQEAYLEWVKANVIGSDGKYWNKSTTHQVRVTPSVHGGTFPYAGSGKLPPQVALVLSLRTGNRGPREAWGHVYMPCQSLELASGKPTISTNAANNIASKFADFINSLNATPSPASVVEPKVVIASKYSSYTDRKSGVHKTFQASLTPVTDVWVGDKYDTHRSRANKIAQTYSKVDLT